MKLWGFKDLLRILHLFYVFLLFIIFERAKCKDHKDTWEVYPAEMKKKGGRQEGTERKKTVHVLPTNCNA